MQTVAEAEGPDTTPEMSRLPQLWAGEWLRAIRRTVVVFLLTSAVATAMLAAWAPTLAFRAAGPGLRARIRRRAQRTWGRGMMLATGVRVSAEGTPPPDGALVVSNHLGYLDIAAVNSVAPMVFVSRADVRRWPFWGAMAALGGTVFVDRARKRDVIRVRRDIEAALGRGDRVLIFPEATTTDGSTIRPLKPALLAAAAERNMPVYWMTLSYGTPPGSPSARDRVCWWQGVGFVPHALALFGLKRAYCTIRFGDTPVRATDRKELAVALRTRMLQRFEPVT
ncbi:MAG: lysophospholipid acyltransferase family protein [Gemmatimonadota bacterium]|nr:lysophospholipid acyltransferase family protein [Gemmatimonadota bacterium]